jgi:hypothetical protein
MKEDEAMEVLDLGDAVEETRQCDPYMPIRPDAVFGWASESYPWPGC